MTTGERIKARRKQLSISADELAKRVGVSRSTVFRWEKGEIEKIPAVQMNLIARVLQTSESYLFGWSDDPEPNAPIENGATNQATKLLNRLTDEELQTVLTLLRQMTAGRE